MKTGFIGLGAMGMEIARNLHRHGLLVAAWNRTAEKAQMLSNAQLPLIEMTLIQYRRLIEQGHGDEDISTLFRLKTALFK